VTRSDTARIIAETWLAALKAGGPYEDMVIHAAPPIARRAVLAGLFGGLTAGGMRSIAEASTMKPKPPPVSIIDGLMYPPGYRLGIDVAGALEPNHNGGWEQLKSDDGSLIASYHISYRFGDAADDDWWERHLKEPANWRLDSTNVIGGDIERRLWSDPNNNEGENGDATFFVGYRTDAVFEGLDLRTVPPADSKAADPAQSRYKRWRPTMEHILASARLRAPVGIPHLLDELRIAVDFGDLHARSLGSRIALTLEPLPMPRVRGSLPAQILLTGGVPLDYVLIREATRDQLVAQFDALVRVDVPIMGQQGPGRRIIGNEIDWFELPETRGEAYWSAQVTGIGQTQVTNISANYVPALNEPTLAALDAVIRSYRFL
jgi:hypothetical protein